VAGDDFKIKLERLNKWCSGGGSQDAKKVEAIDLEWKRWVGRKDGWDPLSFVRAGYVKSKSSRRQTCGSPDDETTRAAA
jgi:hypothetical protein